MPVLEDPPLFHPKMVYEKNRNAQCLSQLLRSYSLFKHNCVKCIFTCINCIPYHLHLYISNKHAPKMYFCKILNLQTAITVDQKHGLQVYSKHTVSAKNYFTFFIVPLHKIRTIYHSSIIPYFSVQIITESTSFAHTYKICCYLYISISPPLLNEKYYISNMKRKTLPTNICST